MLVQSIAVCACVCMCVCGCGCVAVVCMWVWVWACGSCVHVFVNFTQLYVEVIFVTYNYILKVGGGLTFQLLILCL